MANDLDTAWNKEWKWNPGQGEAALLKIHDGVMQKVQGIIQWYYDKKKWKAWWSQLLRAAAIVLTTVGGLIPLVSSLGWLTFISIDKSGQLPYLFLGVAAGCVGLDKFFGFSSGWIRYITTALALEKARDAFNLDWIALETKANLNPGERLPQMLQRLSQFSSLIDTLVEQETQAWVNEFQSSLSQFEKAANERLEAVRPGAIEVTISNAEKAQDGFILSLDGMAIERVQGSEGQIGHVTPGLHKVAVAAVVGGQSVIASQIVNVAPGIATKVTLALPVTSSLAATA